MYVDAGVGLEMALGDFLVQDAPLKRLYAGQPGWQLERVLGHA